MLYFFHDEKYSIECLNATATEMLEGICLCDRVNEDKYRFLICTYKYVEQPAYLIQNTVEEFLKSFFMN